MVRPSAPISLQLPEPDSGVHRLLAGVGNLPGDFPRLQKQGYPWMVWILHVSDSYSSNSPRG